MNIIYFPIFPRICRKPRVKQIFKIIINRISRFIWCTALATFRISAWITVCLGLYHFQSVFISYMLSKPCGCIWGVVELGF